MIYPKKNIFLRGIFDVYVRYILKRHFYQINFNKVAIDPEKPVLLIANHFSFWDGLILYRMLMNFSKKHFHVMLLEKTAKKEPMLKYAGAFSVNKGNRDVIQALDYAAELLNDSHNLVLIYPQGKLYSNFIDEVIFEKGVLRIMEAAKGKFQLLFAATFVENFRHKKPTANVYLQVEPQTNFDSIAKLAQSYQQHYNVSRQQQTQQVL